MPHALRNVLAVIIGLVVGGVVNMACLPMAWLAGRIGARMQQGSVP